MILTEASNQWWSRPDDERYLSLSDLHAATLARANASETRDFPTLDVNPLMSGDPYDQSPLLIETPGGYGPDGRVRQLGLTDWSFAQLCSRAGIDTRTARRLLAGVPRGKALVSVLLSEGLTHLSRGEETQLYVRTEADEGQLMGLTSPTYGRIYDHQVVEAVQAVNSDGRWTIPAASYQVSDPLRATTLYASSRDIFLFLVDETRSIEIRTPSGVRHLHRGFFLSNSEVGIRSFTLTAFLYDYVCDNRLVWGVENVTILRIRHTSGAPERFRREACGALRKYSESSPRQLEAQLEAAARFEVGRSSDDVDRFLKDFGYTGAEALKVRQKAREEEGGDRNLWQLVNGATAAARSIPHSDQRVGAETRAARLLKAVS